MTRKLPLPQAGSPRFIAIATLDRVAQRRKIDADHDRPLARRQELPQFRICCKVSR
jgi:hypothetical protein